MDMKIPNMTDVRAQQDVFIAFADSLAPKGEKTLFGKEKTTADGDISYVPTDVLPPNCALYVNTGSFIRDRAKGSYIAASADNIEHCLFLMLDDIGTKAKTPPIEPTWKIETSPGNFQWGYAYAADSRPTKAEQSAAVKAFAAAGFSDPGANNPVRWSRIPGSLNKRKGFVAVLHEFHPERRFVLSELCAAMGVTPGEQPKQSEREQPKQSEREQPKQSGTGSMLCSLEQLPELLSFLDPDMRRFGDGEGWTVAGMGIKQAFGEAGYPAWLEWSKKGEKFKNDRQCEQQWKSFKDKPGGIGFGSVVDMAVAAGWKPAPDVSGMFGPVQEESRRQAQRDQNRRIGEGDEFDPFPEELTVADMLKRFVFLADGSRVMDAAHPAHVLSFADFKNQTASCKTPIKTGEYQRNGNEKVKEVPNATLWIQDPNRQSAISTTFKAGAEFYVCDPNGRHCVNLWAGFKQGKVAPQWAVEMLFVEHVRWLFGDRADDFLDWLAHIQQKPGELPHTAWLHISSHTGTGRNWVAGVLARVFAGHVAASLDLVAMLENGFNERLSRKVLAVVDEIRTGGNDQWNHAETMKQMVTAEVRNINTKYGRQSLEFNSCRWLLFSNHRSAIPITDEDRRFEVVISDQPPKDEGYYATLYAAMNDPAFIRGVAWYLSQRDLSRFNAGRHAKKDSAKQQVIGASQSDMVTSLKEFTAKYPFELVTASRLQAVVGETMFGQKVKAFSHAADDVGWVKLKQVMLPSGMRPRLYARKQAAKAWIDADGSECAKQLPKCDGGVVDWTPDL